MKQLGVNNLPKVVAQQRYGRGSNSRPLDRKSDALSLSHRATPATAPPTEMDQRARRLEHRTTTMQRVGRRAVRDSQSEDSGVQGVWMQGGT